MTAASTDRDTGANGLRVMVAPATRNFRDGRGSEDGWIVDLVNFMLKIDPSLSVRVLAEDTDEGTDGHLERIALGVRRSHTLGGFALPFRVLMRTRKVLRSERVDLVHHALPFAYGFTFSLLPFVGRSRKLPFVVGPVQPRFANNFPDQASVYLGRHKGALPGFVDRVIQRRLTRAAFPMLSALSYATMRSANVVVSTSHAISAELVDNGVPKERIMVIPPPIRVSSMAAARRSSDGPLHLLTAGHLIKRKSVGTIIEALAMLTRGGAQAELTVVGDGPERSALERLARELEVDALVNFTGWKTQAELDTLFALADVYVSAAIEESWGSAALVEAMARGAVAVASDNVGARSVRDEGVPLRLWAVGSVPALVAELSKLPDKAALHAEGGRIAELVRAKFAPDEVARRWLDVYRFAMDSPREHQHGRRSRPTASC